VAVAHGNDFLVQACLYFAAAVAAVMISHRLRVAGIAIGPWGFGLACREAVRSAFPTSCATSLLAP
jgi:hypothetical protein